MRNIPVIYWILLVLAVFGLFYYRNRAKAEAQSSTTSTKKLFSGGGSPVTYGEMLAQLQK